MCHAQITESCTYHESETQAEYFHRSSTGLFRRFHRAPDPLKRDLPVSELLDRCDTGKSVPDLDQPLQGPGTCDCFPFVLGGEHGFLSIRSLSIVRRDLRNGAVGCEVEWHVVLLSYSSWPCSACTATPSIAPRAPQCKSRAPYPFRKPPEILLGKDWIPAR